MSQDKLISEELSVPPSTVAAAASAVVMTAALSTSARPLPSRRLRCLRSASRGFWRLTWAGGGGSAGTFFPSASFPWRPRELPMAAARIHAYHEIVKPDSRAVNVGNPGIA